MNLSDSKLNGYSLDYFVKTHEYYVNIFNNINTIGIGCPPASGLQMLPIAFMYF